VFGLLVGVGVLKTVSLDRLLKKFNERVSKLPIKFQTVFYEDLETAVEHRLKVLESAT
jgi:hypothetical protein